LSKIASVLSATIQFGQHLDVGKGIAVIHILSVSVYWIMYACDSLVTVGSIKKYLLSHLLTVLYKTY